MEEHPTGEPLVIPLELPRRQMRRLVVISVLLPLGAVVIFATDPSRTNGIYGGLAIGALVVVWAVILAKRLSLRGAPNQLVADAEGIRSPKFRLSWARVERMWIGPLPALAGGHPALWIDVFEPADIEWLGAGARTVAGATRTRTLRIPAAYTGIPLEELAADLEALAGRPLLDRA